MIKYFFNLKKRIALDYLNLQNNLEYKKVENNKLYLFFIFKWYFVTIVRYVTKKKFDYNLNIFILIFSVIISFFRYTMICILRLLDFVLPPLYGAKTTLLNRQITCHGVSINVKSRDSGTDKRIGLWKKDAFVHLINLIKKKEIKNINFLEIGAANGIVSLMLSQWCKKNEVNFQGHAIEPNYSNLLFIEENALLNNLDIKTLPVAINKKKWTLFQNFETKGLVGNAIEDKKKSIYKFSLNVEEVFNSIKFPNLIYIDAFLNESQIILDIINKNITQVAILTEFDNGISKEIREICEKKGFKILKLDEINYFVIK